MSSRSAKSAQPASQQGMRRQNLALVMATVSTHGPLSRAEVASHTRLTRAAVSSLVEELHVGGLLTELGRAASGRVGRPGSALALNDQGPAGLGLEVGVEHLGACIVDLRGQVRDWEQVEAGNRGRDAEAVLAELATLADRTAEQAAAHQLRPAALVIAVPGLIGTTPGTVHRAPNLGWHATPVERLLRDRLPASLRQLPLEVENEANLGALAELWRGVGVDSAVHVSAEAGIGAALLTNGELFRGARGYAGELGHVPVHPDGPPCACGAHGCLEQYAGEEAVLRSAGMRAASGERIAALAKGAAGGNSRALDALEQAGSALGIALAGAVNLIDPAAVVLGGGYAELGTWLLPAMRRELAARVTVRPWSPQSLIVSALGRRGPLLGAGTATVRRIIEDPSPFTSLPTAR